MKDACIMQILKQNEQIYRLRVFIDAAVNKHTVKLVVYLTPSQLANSGPSFSQYSLCSAQ